MKSKLIRYINSNYAESFLKGDLYLSSLSSFWSIKKGRICNKKPSSDKLENAKRNQSKKQQDFSEGIATQIPKDKIPKSILKTFGNHILHDVRFRIEAYGYCNLLCFYRVDIKDFSSLESMDNPCMIDEDNIAYLARYQGIQVTGEQLRSNLPLLHNLLDTVVIPNPLLSSTHAHLINLPYAGMDSFGDAVVIIKKEEEFMQRVLEAIKSRGELCVIGDVKYHNIQDRAEQNYTIGTRPHISFITGGASPYDFETEEELKQYRNNLIPMKALIGDTNEAIQYGCLDKYSPYAFQKEWRICWLPKEKNFEAKVLKVGNLENIVEIIPTKDLRQRLMQMYPGYIPGLIEYNDRKIVGNISYKAFKETVEKIDGLCRIIIELG